MPEPVINISLDRRLFDKTVAKLMDESLTKAVCHKKDTNDVSFLILQQVAHLVGGRKSRAKRETHPSHQSLNDNPLPTFFCC